jgi:phytoene dehydrogenase-like protein
MADAKFDAVFVGGGNKALALAMYLARYGGMKVGIFERRHELGGGWSSAEQPLPGFLNDTHSTFHFADRYHGPLWEDFPDWEEKGAKSVTPEVCWSMIFRENHSCLIFYDEKVDPDQERTAKGIARFSERDAEMWLRWWKLYKEVIRDEWNKDHWNPAPPVGTPSHLEEVLDSPSLAIDPLWRVYSGEQLAHNYLESPEMQTWLVFGGRGHSGIPPDYPGGGLKLFLTMFFNVGIGLIKGGGHQLAHASIRVINEHGGEFFTHSEVDKVIIDNGQANGIRLLDGTEVEATKAVISTLDPYSLCFRLIGREYLSSEIINRVQSLIRNVGTLCWNAWAVREKANWLAADWNPDINKSYMVQLASNNPLWLQREYNWRRLGIHPPPEDTPTDVVDQSTYDEIRAPQGLAKYTLESFVAAGDLFSEKEWLEYKKQKVILEQAIWQRYAPNMTWDNIIACHVNSPYDNGRLVNLGPAGDEFVISNVPSQVDSYRPIPELARHRTPIKSLYATGSAWPPGGCAASWQGYNCYKIMAEDYGLRKPWEEKGRPY